MRTTATNQRRTTPGLVEMLEKAARDAERVDGG